MTTTEEIQVPQEYIDKSKKITKLYDDFLTSGESLDQLVTELRNILVNAGFSKTQAMTKIAEDHKHLRRFSLENIYKMLPKEEKRVYTKPPPDPDSNFTGSVKDSNRTKLDNNDVTTTPPPPESQSLKEFRETKGTLEQTHQQPQSPPPTTTPQDEEPQEPGIKYDTSFVDRLVKENAELKEKLEKFVFEYPLEMTDEILRDIKRNNAILPLTATAYPLKDTGVIRFDRSRLKK